MDWKQKVVTQLPIQSLWDDHGPVVASRVRQIDRMEIESELRSARSRLVILDLGAKPHWVHASQLMEFWKSEISGNVVASERFRPDHFPGSHCFIATLWLAENGAIVVLEKGH